MRGLLSVAFFLLLLLFAGAAPSDAQDLMSVRTVVIDAGHGGKDPGTVYGSVKEKDINLEVALALGKKIKDGYPDVKVIYTRTRDVFIPLVERGSIANRNKADLFISIHVNAGGKGSTARGTETFVMGVDKSKSNMELCRRENSVITLEDDYTTTYAGFDADDADSFILLNLMQSAQFEQSIYFASLVEDNFTRNGPIRHSRGIKQAPLVVLWRTTMPSVLVEVGFLSSSSDRKSLTDKESRAKMAECIFDAFVSYKKKYDPAFEPPVTTDTVTVVSPDIRPAKPSAGDTLYRVQIFAVSTKLPAGAAPFQGEKNYEYIEAAGLYKYVIGRFKNRSEADAELARLKIKFPGAFVIRTDGENRILK
ncbi:MAG: N-acetylmuramoyl-L-alanine amidase [Bacteroidales bacterium]|nr:N-acetylmuramoyl-L-alanine amidase [Bacteroidales bacterium]